MGKEGNKPYEYTGMRQGGTRRTFQLRIYMIEEAIGGHLPYNISRSQELFAVVCGLWLELIRQGCGSCVGIVHRYVNMAGNERTRKSGWREWSPR